MFVYRLGASNFCSKIRSFKSYLRHSQFFDGGIFSRAFLSRITSHASSQSSLHVQFEKTLVATHTAMSPRHTRHLTTIGHLVGVQLVTHHHLYRFKIVLKIGMMKLTRTIRLTTIKERIVEIHLTVEGRLIIIQYAHYRKFQTMNSTYQIDQTVFLLLQ